MTPEAESDYDTPRRFRAPDDEWEPFEAATRAMHPEGRSPRAKVLREFMRWYMRRPGAKIARTPACWLVVDTSRQLIHERASHSAP
jgi:hypothetical protein